jgi:hypothetical protein
LRKFRITLNRDFIHENIHLFSVSDEMNVPILNEVIPLLNEDHWENIYQIRSLIELFINKNRIDLISNFFNKNIEEDNWESLYKYYVAFQPIHKAAKLKNKSLISFVKRHINTSKIVQQVLLQLYVEEDCLEGYYGEWVNSCKIFLTTDIEIFTICIKVQYHFIKNEMNEVKKLIKILNQQVDKINFKIHPIILGRIAAWNFIVNLDSNHLERLVFKNKDVYENIASLTFFYRLVYLYGKKDQFIQYDYITFLQTDNLQYTNTPFNVKTELSMFYLILCRFYVEKESKDLAKKTIEKIDIRYQFTCSSNFFVKEYKKLTEIITAWE